VQGLERLPELLEETSLLQAALDAGDDEILSKSNVSIKLGEKDFADRALAREGLAALDLKRDRTDLGVQLDLAKPKADVHATPAVGEVLHERVDAALPVSGAELVVLKQVADDLREVGLAGAEEARDPHPHDVTRSTTTPKRLADLGERINDTLQLVLDLVGDDVLAHFVGQSRTIEHLDDALDLDADVAFDDFSNGGHVLVSLAAIDLPLSAQKA